MVSCSVTEKYILGSSTKGKRREARGEGRGARGEVISLLGNGHFSSNYHMPPIC